MSKISDRCWGCGITEAEANEHSSLMYGMCESCMQTHCWYCAGKGSKDAKNKNDACDDCSAAIDAETAKRAYNIWQTTGREDAVANWLEAETSITVEIEKTGYLYEYKPCFLPAWVQARLKATHPAWCDYADFGKPRWTPPY